MLPRHRLAIPFVVITAGYGCALSLDTDEYTKGAASNDGGPRPDAAPTTSSSSGSVATEAGSDEAGADASFDASDAQSHPSCAAGELVKPIKAFDLGVASGVVCDPESALVDDGKFAGLDRQTGAEGVLDGKPVTGCLAFDFGPVVHLSGVRVHAKPVGSACGSTPCAVSDPAGCGTGHSFSLFGGLTKDSLVKGAVVDNTDTDNTYLAVFEGGRDVGVIAICREAWGSGRDDIAIDFVVGVCQ